MKEINVKKKKVSQKEFESVVATGHSSFESYFLHRIVSVLRRMNRDEKIEDWELSAMHDDIYIYLEKPKA